MSWTTEEIFRRFHNQGLLLERLGPADAVVARFAPVEECRPGDLVFVDRPKFLERVAECRPAAVVTDARLAPRLATDCPEMAILVAVNVKLAMALIRQALDDRDVYATEWPRIHPSAVIHASARVADDALVGPGVVVGADADIGARAVLMANVVVEQGARIGAQSVVHPGVVVCTHCQIGCEVILKPGCVIGAEGFGFAQDAQRRHIRIPHTGIVVIEDRVVIGANTTIDRGTYGTTRVKSGSIVDALCHFGHNVEIGENCVVCAQTGLSGSTRFGDRVIATGQTGTIDHVTVADDVVLLHRAGLPNSIKEPGMYAGGPAQPLDQYKRNMAVLPRLHELLERVRELEKKLDDIRGG